MNYNKNNISNDIVNNNIDEINIKSNKRDNNIDLSENNDNDILIKNIKSNNRENKNETKNLTLENKPLIETEN